MADADLIIIGAGPAGMAAAATAAEGGARVQLLDEQPRAGGQIYRNVGINRARLSHLGPDYVAGTALVDALSHPGITTEFRATAWRIDPGFRVAWSRDGTSHISVASYVLLAGGAQERPMPFPGWTLPGVMPAGAAQILMKTADLLPRDAVLAGSGPLLYLMAAQMIDAGAPPSALVETQTRNMLFKASHHLPRAMIGAATLLKGLGLLRKITAAGVRRHIQASAFRAEAADTGHIAFSFSAQEAKHRIVTPLLLVHQGVVPSTHLSRAAGIAHDWDDTQHAFRPIVDEWGRSNHPGLYVAGDGAGIVGAEAARHMGRLAALDILHRLGRSNEDARNREAAKDRAGLRRAMAIRPFLDTAYAVRPEFLAPCDETLVCRCEEVTGGEIRRAIDEGANGPRQVKTATRAGMGPCQGRMCELTLRGMLSSYGQSPGPSRARNPIKPIKLGELAALALQEERCE